MSFRSRLGSYTIPLIVVLGSLIFFLNTVEVFRDNIALYHDALWDFIPAVAFARSESLVRSYEVRFLHHSLPIQSSPYSGALKIWLLTPVVKLLPMSPRVALICNVLFGLIYLLALYWALLPLAGKIWSSVAFLIPFVDTNFLITAPVDAGIDLTQYIFIALALGTFFRFTLEYQLKHYRATWFLCGCILAQKLTALPVVIGVLCVLAAVSFKRFLESARSDTMRRAIKSYVLIPLALFVAPLSCQIYYFQRHGFGELRASTSDGVMRPFFVAIRSNFAFFFTSFDGWDWYRRLTLDDRVEMIKTPYLSILGLCVIAVSLAVFILFRRGRKTGRDSALSFAIGSLSFLLFPAFRGLYRPWHFYILEPLFLFCFVLSVRHLLDWAGPRFKYVSRAVACAMLSFLILVSVRHSSNVLNEFKTRQGICLASPAFYDLYNSILRSNVKVVHAINYSMAYPMYVLSKGNIRVDDLAWTQLTPARMAELIQNVEKDPDSVIVYRYCGCKQSEQKWIEWINREEELAAFIKTVAAKPGELSTLRFRDKRQTELVLISQKGRPIR